MASQLSLSTCPILLQCDLSSLLSNKYLLWVPEVAEIWADVRIMNCHGFHRFFCLDIGGNII
jgi:hypothetical protein